MLSVLLKMYSIKLKSSWARKRTMITSATHGFWNCNDYVESELHSHGIVEKGTLNPQMIFIFWKSTGHFVKITKCYLNHRQQPGFIHPAHPNHNYQAVKAKAGTRLCLLMHGCSHSLQRVHCPVRISAFQAPQLGLDI